MSLSEALKDESSKWTRKCLVCEWISGLPEKDQESFKEWINSGRPIATLFRASQRQEPPVPVQRSSFERHCREHVL